MKRHAKFLSDVIEDENAPSGIVESFYDPEIGAELFRITYLDGRVVTCTVAELLFCCQPCPGCARKLELFHHYKKTLEGLTPGGSEFVDDPERCATAIRDRFAGPVTILKRQKVKLEAAEEMGKALKNAIGYFIEMQAAYENAMGISPSICAYALEMEDALASWDKAGKGEK